MPRGGSKPGERRGGREKGTPNKSLHPRRISAIEGVRLAKAEDRTPLQFLLGVQNAAPWVQEIPEEQFARRLQAAIAAAPYCHARLAAVAYVPPPDDAQSRRREMLRQLTYQQRKAIEGILLAGDAEIEGDATGSIDPIRSHPPDLAGTD
jgi:hypothetical protein